MDLIDMHERAIELILEVLQAESRRKTPNPLNTFRVVTDRGFWRAWTTHLTMTSRLYDLSPDEIAINERLFGPLPQGDSFGERALRSLNPTKAIADELHAAAPITSNDLDLLERIHTNYISTTGWLDFTKLYAGFIGLIAVAGKLVPKEVFDVFHWHWYGWYQLVVTALAVYVVMNLGIAWLITSRSVEKRQSTSRIFADVLMHLRLRAAGPVGQQ